MIWGLTEDNRFFLFFPPTSLLSGDSLSLAARGTRVGNNQVGLLGMLYGRASAKQDTRSLFSNLAPAKLDPDLK